VNTKVVSVHLRLLVECAARFINSLRERINLSPVWSRAASGWCALCFSGGAARLRLETDACRLPFGRLLNSKMEFLVRVAEDCVVKEVTSTQSSSVCDWKVERLPIKNNY